MLKHLHIIFLSLIYHLYTYIYIYISSIYHRCTWILYIYIVCILHLCIICIACLNEIYDITFHIVRIHSWCVLIHYMCYLSEWDVYDLFVISSIWGGGAAPSPPTPLQLFQAKPSQAIFRPSSSRSVNNSRLLSLNVITKTMPTPKKTCKPNNKQSNKSENWNINEYQEKLQELMKKEEQQWKKHATTNEKQGKPCKNPWKTTNNHAKTNETPWKNQGETMQKPMKAKEKQWKQMYPPYLSYIYVSFV